MKVIILAAGQGTRLRPLTDDRPKCMVEVGGKSIIDRQLDALYQCGVREEDVVIVGGYKAGVLKERLSGTGIQFVDNIDYKNTNMVYSLMCAADILEAENDIAISYGDIFFDKEVFQKLQAAANEISVVVDDGWHGYWSKRCENPLDDAETLVCGENGCLIEIGQKTDDPARVQAQYIGLMRFKGRGIKDLLGLAADAAGKSSRGEQLWRTSRSYEEMYMTDLLQGLADEGKKLHAVHIQRGWFEVDSFDDLKLAESEL